MSGRGGMRDSELPKKMKNASIKEGGGSACVGLIVSGRTLMLAVARARVLLMAIDSPAECVLPPPLALPPFPPLPFIDMAGGGVVCAWGRVGACVCARDRRMW